MNFKVVNGGLKLVAYKWICFSECTESCNVNTKYQQRAHGSIISLYIHFDHLPMRANRKITKNKNKKMSIMCLSDLKIPHSSLQN